MEKHPDQFDDQIREVMKGQRLTPSREARKAFLDEASLVVSPRKGWRNWFYFPLIIFILSGLVVVFVFNFNEDEEVVSGQRSAVGGKGSAVGSRQSSVVSRQSPVVSRQSSVAGRQSPVVSRQSSVVSRQLSIVSRQLSVVSRQLAVGSQQSSVVSRQSSVEILERTNTDFRDTTIINSEPETNPLAPDSIRKPMTVNQKERWRVAAAVYYLPELMFNTIEGDKYIHNTGIDAVFYHGLISIRTGIGISVSKGITRNEVNYNSYMGSYNKLDSITFNYNETQHRFEPNIYTSSQNVWDTLVQSDSSEIIKRYTYLQVPLVLGFDFWKKDRISIGVRVGTIMSVMMKARQLTGEYDPGENLVIGINQLTPSQVNLNWQAVGGIAASAVLTEKISLEIEPQAKYYYGSIYEKSGYAKKPWSLGIRASLLMKF